MPPEPASAGTATAPAFDDVIESISLELALHAPAAPQARQRMGAALAPWCGRAPVYLLHGASRTEWEHSIPPLATLRYSITFRSLARRAASGR